MVDWSNNQEYYIVISHIIIIHAYLDANLCILLFTPPKFMLKHIKYISLFLWPTSETSL